MSGFEARVMQHEFDHQLGLNILDWEVSQGQLYGLNEELEEVLEEYRYRIRSYIKQELPQHLQSDIETLRKLEQPPFYKEMIQELFKIWRFLFANHPEQ